MNDFRFPVVEIYRAVQGEGDVVGMTTTFVRLGGCDYRCVWCDSMFSVLPEYKSSWSMMDASQVADAVLDISPYGELITFSGGNPALFPLELIMRELGDKYLYAIETQGSVYKQYFGDMDYLTLSPKPPSSNNVTDKDMVCSILKAVNGNKCNVCIKIVVFDDVDYEYAVDLFNAVRKLKADLDINMSFVMQVGNNTITGSVHVPALLNKYSELCEKVLRDKYVDIRVIPQVHTLAYGNKRGI